jgi:hypothetical protein
VAKKYPKRAVAEGQPNRRKRSNHTRIGDCGEARSKLSDT